MAIIKTLSNMIFKKDDDGFYSIKLSVETIELILDKIYIFLGDINNSIYSRTIGTNLGMVGTALTAVISRLQMSYNYKKSKIIQKFRELNTKFSSVKIDLNIRIYAVPKPGVLLTESDRADLLNKDFKLKIETE